MALGRPTDHLICLGVQPEHAILVSRELYLRHSLYRYAFRSYHKDGAGVTKPNPPPILIASVCICLYTIHVECDSPIMVPLTWNPVEPFSHELS